MDRCPDPACNHMIELIHDHFGCTMIGCPCSRANVLVAPPAVRLSEVVAYRERRHQGERRLAHLPGRGPLFRVNQRR